MTLETAGWLIEGFVLMSFRKDYQVSLDTNLPSCTFLLLNLTFILISKPFFKMNLRHNDFSCEESNPVHADNRRSGVIFAGAPYGYQSGKNDGANFLSHLFLPFAIEERIV